MVTKSIPGIEAGDMIVVLSSVELPGFGRVQFYEPLAPILFLFVAREDEERATQRRETMLRQLGKTPPGQERRPDPFLINEAIRLGASAVVAAMSALEAFCSEMVGPDGEYERTDKKGNTTTLNASQIEWLSIGERFGVVLPALLDRDSIVGTKLAEDFERIKDLRNAVVHPKQKEIHTIGDEYDPRRVWSRILRAEYLGAAMMAQDVMEHFSPGYVTTIDARGKS
jgi:hypothetical protein